MYYATGLPGWMRFGYSPGWGGMPPGAQYLSQTGQMPQFTAWMQQQAPPAGMPPAAVAPMAPAGMTKEQEIQMLEAQLDQIKRRLEELKR
jgi:hypothetical protein